MKKIKFILVMLLSVVMLSSCVIEDKHPELTGTYYYNGASVNIVFENGTFYGKLGETTYNGTYTLNKTALTLTFITSPKTSFKETLERVNKCKVLGEALYMYGSGFEIRWHR